MRICKTVFFLWQSFVIHFSGPMHWGTVDQRCDGKRQSPIDIVKLDASPNTNLEKIKLEANWDTSNLDNSKVFKLENKGYTVQLDIKEKIETTQGGKISSYEKSPLKNKYYIENFFHGKIQEPFSFHQVIHL